MQCVVQVGSVGVEGGEGEGDGKAEGEGADSLASPRAGSAARCVLCRTPLAHADGTPKLMECLHSACEPCIKSKLDEKLSTNRDFLGDCLALTQILLILEKYCLYVNKI